MKVRQTGCSAAKVEQQMTPMIDVVFQLLTFFLMSFRVVSLEGDFHVQMPLSQRQNANAMHVAHLSMHLELDADDQGALAGVRLNGESLKLLHWDDVTSRIAGLVTQQDRSLLDPEVEIRCDDHLKYRHIIDAIAAVSARKSSDGQVVRLVEKIKLAPPAPALANPN